MRYKPSALIKSSLPSCHDNTAWLAGAKKKIVAVRQWSELIRYANRRCESMHTIVGFERAFGLQTELREHLSDRSGQQVRVGT